MQINLKSSLVLALLLTVLIGAGAAMAGVKVGFLGGFTGPLKSMTPAVYKAAKLAVKHVNDQGGVLDGQKIIMPNADTTCADTAAFPGSSLNNVMDRLITHADSPGDM